MKTFKIAAAGAVLGLLLGGCVSENAQMSNSFGASLKEGLVAQIDPPAAKRDTPPGSDGARAALAQTRYQTGKTIEPVAIASKVGTTAAAPSGAQ